MNSDAPCSSISNELFDIHLLLYYSTSKVSRGHQITFCSAIFGMEEERTTWTKFRSCQMAFWRSAKNRPTMFLIAHFNMQTFAQSLVSRCFITLH